MIALSQRAPDGAIAFMQYAIEKEPAGVFLYASGAQEECPTTICSKSWHWQSRHP
jgi:hypothetical protein